MLSQQTLLPSLSCIALLSCKLSKDMKHLPETTSPLLMNIQQKDSCGNIIFWKNNFDEPIYAVGVKENDSLQRVSRSYLIPWSGGCLATPPGRCCLKEHSINSIGNLKKFFFMAPILRCRDFYNSGNILVNEMQ